MGGGKPAFQGCRPPQRPRKTIPGGPRCNLNLLSAAGRSGFSRTPARAARLGQRFPGSSRRQVNAGRVLRPHFRRAAGKQPALPHLPIHRRPLPPPVAPAPAPPPPSAAPSCPPPARGECALPGDSAEMAAALPGAPPGGVGGNTGPVPHNAGSCGGEALGGRGHGDKHAGPVGNDLGGGGGGARAMSDCAPAKAGGEAASAGSCGW